MSGNAPDTLVGLLDRCVARVPDNRAIVYFDGHLSYAQLAQESDALACAFQREGIRSGDRLMICLQNEPDFVVALLAAAKSGVIVVPVNPMYKEREFAGLVEDCEPAAIVAGDGFLRNIVAKVSRAPVRRYAVSPFDRQSRNDARVFGEPEAVAADAQRLNILIGRGQGQRPDRAASGPDDPALLVYTSGTTGKPKGAIISHGNLCAGAEFYRSAAGLDERSRLLGVAPLFHVTGLSGHIGASLAAGGTLILCHRFHPEVVLAEIEAHQPTFIVAAITALMALIDHPDFRTQAFASLQSVFSGGAPIAPALHGKFRERSGLAIRNVYGLTETTAPIVAVPADREAPVDPLFGALSVGFPVPGATVRLIEDGMEVAAGEVGELVVEGPSVVSGYWRNAGATAEAMTPQGFRTGDIGVRDAAGWIYLVDRKKDVIIASGFKVWPREVEDVLYTHPSVREAAVVGVPDPYRGETVKAVVSLVEGHGFDAGAIEVFCRERMASFKCPKIIECVAELPKTATGKIMRRELR